jgi:hypothetical protein
MNTLEMQYSFGIQINQFDTPLELTSDDIFYWLNKSQERLVKDRFTGKRLNVGFEQSFDLIADIQNLIERNRQDMTTYSPEYNVDEFSADKITLPSNYLYLINHRCVTYVKYPEIIWTLNENTNRREPEAAAKLHSRGGNFTQLSDIFTVLDDPFNTTGATSVVTTISGNDIVAYTDKTFVVKEIIIDYIRVPKKLSLNTNDNVTTTTSELPEHLHKEIIELAVDLFLQNTRQLKQRLQLETPTADNNVNEQRQ